MEKARMKMNRLLFDEIPSTIVWDILSRLTTTACLKCKLVCKEWYNIIISSEFAKLRRSHSCDPYFTLLFYGNLERKKELDNSMVNFMLLDFENAFYVEETVRVISMIKFKSEFHIPNCELLVVNDCNGVICLTTTSSATEHLPPNMPVPAKSLKRRAFGRRGQTSSDRGSEEGWNPFILCNPLTSQYMVVEQSCKRGYSVLAYGLGCCPTSQQFKVLRILQVWMTGKFVAEVQTVGTNEWRSVGDAPRCERSIGAFLHGCLHWFYCTEYILSFHFGNEQFSRVPLPTHGSKARTISENVTVLDSCLCFTHTYRDSCDMDIWLMKDYGVNDSWVKQYVLNGMGAASLFDVCPLLVVGEEILLSYRHHYGWGVLAFDLKSAKYKKVEVGEVSSAKVVACNIKLSALLSPM